MNPSYQQQTRDLIDGLKAVCANNGLGNDGNEYKIIVQTFLYKLLCDKFAYEMKRACPALAGVDDWIVGWQALPEEAQQDLQDMLPAETPRLTADQLIPSLFNRQSEPGFAKRWDDTLIAIAVANNDIFAVQTDDDEKVPLFDRLSEYVTGNLEKRDGFVRALFNKLVGAGFERLFEQKYDFYAALFEYLIKDYNFDRLSEYVTGSLEKRDGFVRALFNKLVGVGFERLFEQKYDFYAALFEYLIKDYNKDNGGKYAEYYTPHAVATIMADILVPQDQRGTVKNVTCYDSASGSGTLLMA